MNKKIIERYEGRIARGIRFLDRRFGRKKWAKKVDVAELDLSSGMTCMIGEVTGVYDAKKFGKTDSQMEDMGFYLNDTAGYPLLTRLWIGALYKLGIKG